MKTLFKLFFFFCFSATLAQNLIPSSDWTDGGIANNLSYYNVNGVAGSDINDRGSYFISGENPFGESSVLWHVNSNPNEQNYPRYYGFNTKSILNNQIDISKDYRYSVWVKMIGADATTQAGVFSAGITGTINGGTTTQVQWRSGGNVPSNPINNQWFLMVAYVQGNGSAKIFSDGGVYDLNTNLVGSIVGGSPTLNSGTPNIQLFTFLRFNPGTDQSLEFFDPRFEEVNPSMPSIAQLIDPSLVIGGPGQWSTNTNGIHYNGGNVGIGVDLPNEKLEVNGQIHAREVKVDVNFPAPDYVFYENYDLKTLEEIQQYITEHGHLPNIPSAKEIEANGIELGLMNMKLLEKIEELTLYIINMDQKNTEEIKKLQEQINQLKQ